MVKSETLPPECPRIAPDKKQPPSWCSYQSTWIPKLKRLTKNGQMHFFQKPKQCSNKSLHASFEVSHQIRGRETWEEILPAGQTFALASEIKMCETIHSKTSWKGILLSVNGMVRDTEGISEGCRCWFLGPWEQIPKSILLINVENFSICTYIL